MISKTQQIIFWMPRVLCLLFALFISLFALDVFSEGYNLQETLIALFMHLIPTFIILLALIVAWRWDWVGAILFTALSLILLATSGGESWIISGPLLVVGLLFLFNWLYETRRLFGNPRS